MEPCCQREPVKGRLLRITAWLLPAATWALLPKCPMCLAVWLTAVTGIGCSASDSLWLRWSLLLFALPWMAMQWRSHRRKNKRVLGRGSVIRF